MANNLVSILMPVYNSYDHVRSEGKNLLEIALKSILNQSYTNFELIILDNQSTDQTPTVCQNYARKDRRVKYIRDTKKRFPEGAITYLASLARGDYCLIANDDDVRDSHYVSTLVSYLQKHDNVDLCYTNGQYIDIKGHKLNQLVPGNKYVYSTQESCYTNFIKYLHLRNVIPIGHGVYRTKAFQDTLPYHPFDNLKANVDNLFMIKFFLRNHRPHFINQNLFYYRKKERALDPSKVSDMPPLTHPIDIWNYYGVHQINLYLEIVKLINKNVPNEFYRVFANIQVLTSCVNAAVNLLTWIKDDVADNSNDKKKFFMAMASWKYRVHPPLSPVYERVQFDSSIELSGQSPIINNEVANLKKDLTAFKSIIKKLNYQNDNQYLELRKKFLRLIENETDKVSAMSQEIRAKNRSSKTLTAFPKKRVPFNKKPKISVLVTSYNLSQYLRSTLYSILNQRYDDYEIIVIDGGSTDGSVRELRRLSKMFSQLHFISEKDNGYPDALWKGIRLARGEYIMQCVVSDAYANPDWLAICAKTLDIYKHVSLVWGFPQYLYEKNRIGRISYPEFHTRAAPSEKEFFKYWLRTGFFFPEGNLCVRKKVLIKCYPAIQEITPSTLDWLEFSYRFNRCGYLSRHLPVVANYGRRHKSQMSLSLEKSGQLKRMTLNYFGKLIVYRILLLTKIVRHKFINQDGRIIRKTKDKKLHFHPLHGQVIPLVISKLKRYLWQKVAFTIYHIKHD